MLRRTGYCLAIALLFFSVGFLAAAPAGAATVLFDPFTDGDRALGSDTNDTSWFSNSTGILSVVNNQLRYAPTATYKSFVGAFHNQVTQSLVNINDKLTLTFDFHFIAIPGGTDAKTQFRFGLYNANGTFATADNTTADTNDFGYGAWIRVNGSAASSQVWKEAGPGGTTDHLLTGGTITQIGSNSTNPATLNDTNNHTALLQLIKVAGGVRILAQIDGNTILDVLDSSSVYTSFNEVAIGEGLLTNKTFQVDNIKVDYTPVPLPPAALLLGTGLLGMVLLRSRKRT
jgi:hypothetical protein